jgi:hypothetical protein
LKRGTTGGLKERKVRFGFYLEVIPLVPPFDIKGGHLLPGILSKIPLKNTKAGLCMPCPPLKRGTTGGLKERKVRFGFYREVIPLVPPFEIKGGHLLTKKGTK